jgi:hypothetical protein
VIIGIESEWNELFVMSGCDGKELLALTQRGKCVGLVQLLRLEDSRHGTSRPSRRLAVCGRISSMQDFGNCKSIGSTLA